METDEVYIQFPLNPSCFGYHVIQIYSHDLSSVNFADVKIMQRAASRCDCEISSIFQKSIKLTHIDIQVLMIADD